MSIFTPVGNAFPTRFVTIYSTGATLNNVPGGGSNYLTGSATDCSQYLYKAVMGWMASGASTSFGTENALLYVDISDDNAKWNNSYQSGAFTTLGTWQYQEISKPIRYMRARLLNPSGSAVSGSIVIVGYKYQ